MNVTTNLHPPANRRCQIYGDNCERCINNGTHWIPWGRCTIHTGGAHDTEGAACEAEFYSWECDGPHLFGETAAATAYEHKEAA